MNKRLIALISILLLTLTGWLPAKAAGGGLSNFQVTKQYTDGQFGDVSSTNWYGMAVQTCYEYGLLQGTSDTAFSPRAQLSYAEAIKLAVCLGSVYETGTARFSESTPWYDSYIEAAFQSGLLVEAPADPTAQISRLQFAALLAQALPSTAYPAIGSIADGAIPDLTLEDSNAQAVYMLYRAGILIGCDEYGTFRPQDPLTRAEAAAILARCASAELRTGRTLPQQRSGQELYKKCASAVFYLERYNSEGALMGIGSGFFITADGLAVTNYHVISGASSAIITASDGRTYQVKGICGYDTKKDIAILQIDGSGFSTLQLGDSDQLAVGAHVYALGSPLGLLNTISDGVVSNVPQTVNASSFIQFSAPISQGSGGGPIINEYGQVVGITCLTVLTGQTLNFAVPVNAVADLSRTGCVPLIAIVAQNATGVIYYSSYFPVPDFGVNTGTPLYRAKLDSATGIKTYHYKKSDMTAGEDATMAFYTALLKNNGFEWKSSNTDDNGDTVDIYYNAIYDLTVHVGSDTLDGIACRFVAITSGAK